MNAQGQGDLSASMHTKAQDAGAGGDIPIMIWAVLVVIVIAVVALVVLRMRKK